MVFLTLTQKFNKWLAPTLLRTGLTLRHRIGSNRDNPSLDAAFLIPLAQKLISIESRQDMRDQLGGTTSLMEQLFYGSKSDSPEMKVDRIDATQTRVKILESYLRSALLPSNRWVDVKRWQFHSRTIKWVRQEYLLAKFGIHLEDAMKAFPSLSSSLQLQVRQSAAHKLLSGKVVMTSYDENYDPSVVPKTLLVQKALHTANWSEKKNTTVSASKMRKVADKLGGEVHQLGGGAVQFAVIPNDTDLSTVSFESILELVDGQVSDCGPFNALCEEANIYQLWTEEYIEGLGRYLRKRANSFSGDTLILDVGAGDGLLAKHLNDFFHSSGQSASKSTNRNKRTKSSLKKSPRATSKVPRIVATDDGSWSLNAKAPIENLGFVEALAQYCKEGQQTIVLCSWMPMNEDWTSTFREHNVDEYVLIGESDDGMCGDNWETWGNTDYLVNANPNIPPPYTYDGYKRRELSALLPYQWSRFDSSVSKSGTTVSFALYKRN